MNSRQALSEADRRAVAAWAADCAERVLAVFEAEAPGDDRPQDAIARTRAFARGELGAAGEIRRRFVAGRAAREVGAPAAVTAARAAAQASAVAHMGAHALGAAAYAAKAAGLPGPAQAGVTTHERLRLLGMTSRTDATIDRVEPGYRLQWRAHDREKQLQGSRLVEPTGPASCRFTEVVEGRLLGLARPLEPMIAWLLQRQATADLRRLKQLLEAPSLSGSAPEETAP